MGKKVQDCHFTQIGKSRWVVHGFVMNFVVRGCVLRITKGKFYMGFRQDTFYTNWFGISALFQTEEVSLMGADDS